MTKLTADSPVVAAARKWDKISQGIAKKLPFVASEVLNRRITIDGEGLLMLFDQQEAMKKKIAATYLSQIQDAFQKQAGADLCIKAVFTEDVADHIIDYWKIGGASADAEEETADTPSPQNNKADPLDALCGDFPEIVELTDESDFVHYESETYSQTAFDEDEQEEFLEDQEKGENENG